MDRKKYFCNENPTKKSGIIYLKSFFGFFQNLYKIKIKKELAATLKSIEIIETAQFENNKSKNPLIDQSLSFKKFIKL